MLDLVRSLFRWLHHKVEAGILLLFLHLFFLVGIGLTAIVARLLNQGFLKHRFKPTSWQPMTGSLRPEKLF